MLNLPLPYSPHLPSLCPPLTPLVSLPLPLLKPHFYSLLALGLRMDEDKITKYTYIKVLFVNVLNIHSHQLIYSCVPYAVQEYTFSYMYTTCTLTCILHVRVVYIVLYSFFIHCIYPVVTLQRISRSTLDFILLLNSVQCHLETCHFKDLKEKRKRNMMIMCI